LGREPRREPHKFDPADFAKLERPERQRILPNERVVGLLELGGSETVVDYGAGSGVLSIPVARGLPEGKVHAVDESPEMIEHLRRRLEETGLANVRPQLVRENSLDLESGSVDRVLAVNLLHEVVGETALQEMRRVLRPEGFLLAVDWRADVERKEGPPAEVSLTPEAAREMLEQAGFDVAPVEGERFPYHFAYLARRSPEEQP
jgi:ubiquinone/menaquinone biosynthesis C-methylase UbiE